MKKLTKLQEEVYRRLNSGDTISRYKTGTYGGYDEYYRWDSDLTVVPSKTIWSMRSKGVDIITNLVEGVIVKYDPYNDPKAIKVNKYSDVETNTYEGSKERLGTFFI
jgi:hypothetical protein